ncbi:MAG: chemotaxis protein CheX [Polyangiaceae bacterium]
MSILAPARRPTSTRPESTTAIQKDLELSAIELFQAYGLQGTRASSAMLPADGSETVVAVIGFAAQHARGALVLSATVSSASHWLKAIAGPEVTASACDVIGEIANMLLGRLKSKLAEKGLNVLMSTPTAGQGAVAEIAPNGTSSWMAFQGEGWGLAVRVDVEFDESFRWQETLATSPAAPGDLMIF